MAFKLSGSINFAPPRCEIHNKQMSLYYYERPDRPFRNGWECPFCEEKQQAQMETKWPEDAEL